MSVKNKSSRTEGEVKRKEQNAFLLWKLIWVLKVFYAKARHSLIISQALETKLAEWTTKGMKYGESGTVYIYCGQQMSCVLIEAVIFTLIGSRQGHFSDHLFDFPTCHTNLCYILKCVIRTAAEWNEKFLKVEWNLLQIFCMLERNRIVRLCRKQRGTWVQPVCPMCQWCWCRGC